jgi:outer membrane protein OmpA-like peptidoglycan-associated protein
VFAGSIARGKGRRSALLLSVLALIGGCAGSARKPCPSQAWEGKCKLHAVTKVEEREMPMPYVTYEAIYVPQPNPEYPQFTPSELHLSFGTPAVHEFALVDHLKQQQEVACHAPVAAESCLPGQVTADVVPFDAEHAPPAAAPSIVGCAAIDSASEQDRLARTRTQGSKIDEHFTFGEASAALSPDAANSARDVAKRMAEDPSLECVGVVGQTAPGEPLALAEARARAVKQLLISLGVDSRRLLTIAANANISGAAAKAQPQPPIDPEARRVSLRVLLETSVKSAP